MISVGVVVPNYNGGEFLRQSIDSVLAQDYPNLSCLCIDGQSRDDSLQILQSYGNRISFVSERDDGQADAIAKGFRALDTDLVGWLNSDDELSPRAISTVVDHAIRHPGGVLFHGDVDRIDSGGEMIGHSVSVDLDYEQLRRGKGRVLQPGSFYRRQAVEACGGVDPSWYLLMDLDLWIRLLRHGDAVRIPEVLARFREHPGAKSSARNLRYLKESLRIGWLHEADRPVRATAARLYRLARLELIKQVRPRVSRLWQPRERADRT